MVGSWRERVTDKTVAVMYLSNPDTASCARYGVAYHCRPDFERPQGCTVM